MYAISFAAAIVLAGFWTTVSVFSQVLACSHHKPPIIVRVVRRRQKRVAVVAPKTRCVTFDLAMAMDFKFHDESEESSKRVKAPKLLRSLTTFVGTHRRCSLDSSDSASESDCSSISSGSAGKSPVRPALRRGKTAPGPDRRSVRWADDTELDTGCELYL